MLACDKDVMINSVYFLESLNYVHRKLFKSECLKNNEMDSMHDSCDYSFPVPLAFDIV